ncbi:MAG: hypothetical protein K0S68_917 [Candidatus Saccharibacteria bacterium]|jgi:hypothetical protein|nr:hypothetical protein [Candidatus Saccharibacteria bacterium]
MSYNREMLVKGILVTGGRLIFIDTNWSFHDADHNHNFEPPLSKRNKLLRLLSQDARGLVETAMVPGVAGVTLHSTSAAVTVSDDDDPLEVANRIKSALVAVGLAAESTPVQEMTEASDDAELSRSHRPALEVEWGGPPVALDTGPWDQPPWVHYR